MNSMFCVMANLIYPSFMDVTQMAPIAEDRHCADMEISTLHLKIDQIICVKKCTFITKHALLDNSVQCRSANYFKSYEASVKHPYIFKCDNALNIEIMVSIIFLWMASIGVPVDEFPSIVSDGY